jgi:hypothetical protein
MSRRGPGVGRTVAGALAALWMLALPALGTESAARVEEAPAASSPLLGGGPILPVEGLFAASSGQQAYVQRHPLMNFDVAMGPFFPFDGHEDFDAGVMVDFKFQAEVVPHFFLGGEFAFAGHDVNDTGRLFFDGWLSRFYLMAPIEVDIPIAGYEDNPFSIRFGVAPGMLVVDPYVDHDVDDAAFINGFDIEEEAFVAFNLRGRVGLRFPIGPYFGVILEGVYDWAQGTGKTKVHDFLAGTTTTTKRFLDLSGVSVLFGIQMVF